MVLSILAVAILGAQMTFYLIHHKHLPTVRASSSLTLLFALIVSFLNVPFVGALQAAFFGSTFVGMTDKSRLGSKRVFLASVLYGVMFLWLIPFAQGFGGGLGAAAFVSISIIYSADKYLKTSLVRRFLKKSQAGPKAP